MKIPWIYNWDNLYLALEMSIVHVPCLIDFGGTYLDLPPDHLIRDDNWIAENAEAFGENWEEAQAVISEIEFRASICLVDVNTGNIKF